MEKFFTVSQAAKKVDMTAETLRYYDRIGLVKPCNIDEWTGYRYYSDSEIVLLNTVKALSLMDLTLSEIKEILDYSDFGKIVKLLKRAEESAERKIAELENAQNKIRRARTFYESKLHGETRYGGSFVKNFPQRVILLSDTMDKPTLENLYDYHRSFYAQTGEDGGEFSFEDLAGVYESEETSRLFAVCTKWKQTNGLKILPEGEYLCADCTEENYVRVLEDLINEARSSYNVIPAFTVRIIVLSGILQWNYQIQIYLK